MNWFNTKENPLLVNTHTELYIGSFLHPREHTMLISHKLLRHHFRPNCYDILIYHQMIY